MALPITIAIGNYLTEKGTPPSGRCVIFTNIPPLLFDIALSLSMVVYGILCALSVIHHPPIGFYCLTIGGILGGILIAFLDFYSIAKAKY